MAMMMMMKTKMLENIIGLFKFVRHILLKPVKKKKMLCEPLNEEILPKDLVFSK